VNGRGGKIAVTPTRSRKKILSWVDTPDEVYFVADQGTKYAMSLYLVFLCLIKDFSILLSLDVTSLVGHSCLHAAFGMVRCMLSCRVEALFVLLRSSTVI